MAKNDKQLKSNKVGRNAPCPCGSGLKSKKCPCIAIRQAEEAKAAEYERQWQLEQVERFQKHLESHPEAIPSEDLCKYAERFKMTLGPRHAAKVAKENKTLLLAAMGAMNGLLR
jgi:hypothetical protein